MVRTFSITCQRKEKLAFSTVYFYANQRILAVKGSGIDSAATLAGKRVCAVSGTTSLSTLFALDPRPALVGVTSWTDCLVMLQQGQVDAISTDDVVLAGLAARTRAWTSSGTSMGVEPYGIGIRKDSDDLVRFVNGAARRHPHRRNVGTPLRHVAAQSRAVARPPAAALRGGAMTAKAIDEIDRELAVRAADIASMSAALIELDAHPGMTHMRRYLPSGVTAQRWAHVEETLRQSWHGLTRAMSTLDSARAARWRSGSTTSPHRADAHVARSCRRRSSTTVGWPASSTPSTRSIRWWHRASPRS